MFFSSFTVFQRICPRANFFISHNVRPFLCLFVRLSAPHAIFLRPRIGQHRSLDHVRGLSLVTALVVKIGCINTTIIVLEHSILTLGALLTFSLANTSHIITSHASHFIGATICNGREILCLPYAGFFLLYLSIQLKFF